LPGLGLKCAVGIAYPLASKYLQGDRLEEATLFWDNLYLVCRGMVLTLAVILQAVTD
jgi:hypothetical protein